MSAGNVEKNLYKGLHEVIKAIGKEEDPYSRGELFGLTREQAKQIFAALTQKNYLKTANNKDKSGTHIFIAKQGDLFFDIKDAIDGKQQNTQDGESQEQSKNELIKCVTETIVSAAKGGKQIPYELCLITGISKKALEMLYNQATNKYRREEDER